MKSVSEAIYWMCFCAAFRCAYCFFLNPARKTRPRAPRLPDFNFEKKQLPELQSEAERPESREREPQGNQQTEGTC